MSTIDPFDSQGVLNCATCYGTLTANEVPMVAANGAWCLNDLAPLWGGVEQRGDDTVMPSLDSEPGAPGARAFPRRDAPSSHQLEFWCSGHVDPDGTPALELGRSPEAQLALNMAYLHANVFFSVDTGDGTYPVVWTVPGIGPITGNCRLLLPPGGVELVRGAALLTGTVVIQDPYSELHL